MRTNRVEFYIKQIQKNDPKITHLSLHGNGWGDDVIVRLCQSLSTNNHIVSIDLQRNSIGSRGLAELVKLKNIRALDLSLNCLDDESAKLLSECTHFESLKLGQNSFTNEGLAYFVSQSNCPGIDVGENHNASPNMIARVDAVSAYNKKLKQRFLLGGQNSALEAMQSREDYVSSQWKSFMPKPELKLPAYDFSLAASIWGNENQSSEPIIQPIK